MTDRVKVTNYLFIVSNDFNSVQSMQSSLNIQPFLSLVEVEKCQNGTFHYKNGHEAKLVNEHVARKN